MHNLSSLILILDQESPCPYLPDRIARMPLEMPRERLRASEVDHMLERGYRRSGRFYYHVNCPSCRACQPLRLDVNCVTETTSMRRVQRRGDRAFTLQINPPIVDSARLSLFNRHRNERSLAHGEGDATDFEYESFLVDSCIEVWELSLWLGNQLVAVSVTDVGADSLSAVYCFFDPAHSSLSPGTYAILRQIQLARATNRRWLYLGMYVADNRHLRYKARFYPHQRFVQGNWLDFAAPA